MKIGIVTVQDSNNFGSFLQAYALQFCLQEMGHEVVFLRSRSKKYIKNIFYTIRPNKHELLHLPKFIRNNYKGWIKYRRFQNEQTCFRTIDNYKDEKLDLVILGSDEIWNAQAKIFRKPIFYGVGMKNVMAYGISIGAASVDDMNCIPEQYFHNIRPILARDEHTADFLRTMNIDAPVVCDPTLIVDKSIFKRTFQSTLLNDSPFLLVYSYGVEESVANAIKNYAEKQKLRVLSACFPFDWCDGNFDCTALDFCAVLEKASCVFTSTFHGTIFSILNHKKFVSLPKSRKTSDLLKLLEMEDRLISVEACIESALQNIMEAPIDYDTVDRKIAVLREKSILKLEEGIGEYEI